MNLEKRRHLAEILTGFFLLLMAFGACCLAIRNDPVLLVKTAQLFANESWSTGLFVSVMFQYLVCSLVILVPGVWLANKIIPDHFPTSAELMLGKSGAGE